MMTSYPTKRDQANAAKLPGMFLRAFIANGTIDPRGKSDSALLDEVRHILMALHGEIALITDHTGDLLRQARRFRKSGKYEFSCLFYATWTEHALNGLLANCTARLGISSSDKIMLIRETGLRAKYVWVHLLLLGRAPRASRVFRLIGELGELRNAFVHYKWEPDREDRDTDVDPRLTKTLQGAETLVRYLLRMERDHLYHGIGVRKAAGLIPRPNKQVQPIAGKPGSG